MSDAAAPREWRFYVEDMIAFCDKSLAYTKGLEARRHRCPKTCG